MIINFAVMLPFLTWDATVGQIGGSPCNKYKTPEKHEGTNDPRVKIPLIKQQQPEKHDFVVVSPFL